jgi:hypothetical protein
MKKNIEKKNDQLEAKTLTTINSETLSQILKNLPYSTDRIGQGFVIHLPQPKRDEKNK